MQQSSAPYPLLIQVLTTDDMICGAICDLQKFAVDGDQAKVRDLLDRLAAMAAAHRPSIRQVIASELQAAEVRQAAERGVATVARVLRRQPEEHLHAANDIGHPASNPNNPAA